MSVGDYFKDNLPLILPLFVLSMLLVAFLAYYFCHKFKQNIILSTTRTLYSSTPNRSADRTLVRARRSGGSEAGSEHGFEYGARRSRNSLGTPSIMDTAGAMGGVDMNGNTGYLGFDNLQDSGSGSATSEFGGSMGYRHPLPNMEIVPMSHGRVRKNKSSSRHKRSRRHSGGGSTRGAFNPLYHASVEEMRTGEPQLLLGPGAYMCSEDQPADLSRIARRNSIRHSRRAMPDFRLTPVLEEAGATPSHSSPCGQAVSHSRRASNARLPQQSRVAAVHPAAAGLDPRRLPIVMSHGGRRHQPTVPALHRYSTPLPPGAYGALPARRNGGGGGTGNLSKNSSGMNSLVTNQSAKTYYTNHNDLAHSISSISLSSTLESALFAAAVAGNGGGGGGGHMALANQVAPRDSDSETDDARRFALFPPECGGGGTRVNRHGQAYQMDPGLAPGFEATPPGHATCQVPVNSQASMRAGSQDDLAPIAPEGAPIDAQRDPRRTVYPRAQDVKPSTGQATRNFVSDNEYCNMQPPPADDEDEQHWV